MGYEKSYKGDMRLLEDLEDIVFDIMSVRAQTAEEAAEQAKLIYAIKASMIPKMHNIGNVREKLRLFGAYACPLCEFYDDEDCVDEDGGVCPLDEGEGLRSCSVEFRNMWRAMREGNKDEAIEWLYKLTERIWEL